jgi:hypothetical protein
MPANNDHDCCESCRRADALRLSDEQYRYCDPVPAPRLPVICPDCGVIRCQACLRTRPAERRAQLAQVRPFCETEQAP